jgi:hypothetical protein
MTKEPSNFNGRITRTSTERWSRSPRFSNPRLPGGATSLHGRLLNQAQLSELKLLHSKHFRLSQFELYAFRRKRYGGWNLYPTAVALVRPAIGDPKDDDVPEQYRAQTANWKLIITLFIRCFVMHQPRSLASLSTNLGERSPSGKAETISMAARLIPRRKRVENRSQTPTLQLRGW